MSADRAASPHWLSVEDQAARDRRIVALRAEGLTLKVIAERMHLSASAVANVLKQDRNQRRQTETP